MIDLIWVVFGYSSSRIWGGATGSDRNGVRMRNRTLGGGLFPPFFGCFRICCVVLHLRVHTVWYFYFTKSQMVHLITQEKVTLHLSRLLTGSIYRGRINLLFFFSYSLFSFFSFSFFFFIFFFFFLIACLTSNNTHFSTMSVASMGFSKSLWSISQKIVSDQSSVWISTNEKLGNHTYDNTYD